MTPRASLAVLLLAGLLSTPAQADGRTDGPEGSEVGHGGYQSVSGGKFSLAADFGGAIVLSGAVAGPPLYAGATATLWFTDWFKLDLLGNWVFNAQRLNVLVGPRFSTWGWPVTFGAGLHAGVIYDVGPGVRFGLSPNISADMLFARHFLASLKAALDIPIGAPVTPMAIRIGLSLGWRF